MLTRIRFAKYGVVKFIGHLDVMRYFQKAVRRCNLPIKYSQGFTPHQLMSFALPLGVGVTSDGEYMDLEFDDEELFKAMREEKRDKAVEKAQDRVCEETQDRTEAEAQDRACEEAPDKAACSRFIFSSLQSALTEGFEVLKVFVLPDPKPNTHVDKAMSLVTGAEYLVSVKDGYSLGYNSESELWSAFEEFYNQDCINVVKETKKSSTEMDIKPFIYYAADLEGHEIVTEHKAKDSAVDNIKHADRYESGQRLLIRLAAGSALNIKPQLVIAAFCEFIGQEYNPNAFQIHRTELYTGSERLKPLIF